MFFMFSTIIVRVDDLAIFLKENAKDLFYDNHFPVLALINKWNDSVKEISSYGFFFDGESKDFDYHERYMMPSTSVAIKAVKKLFGLHKSDSIIEIPKELLTSWIYCFMEDYNRITPNYLHQKKWKIIGKDKAKASLTIYPKC